MPAEGGLDDVRVQPGRGRADRPEYLLSNRDHADLEPGHDRTDGELYPGPRVLHDLPAEFGLGEEQDDASDRRGEDREEAHEGERLDREPERPCRDRGDALSDREAACSRGGGGGGRCRRGQCGRGGPPVPKGRLPYRRIGRLGGRLRADRCGQGPVRGGLRQQQRHAQEVRDRGSDRGRSHRHVMRPRAR